MPYPSVATEAVDVDSGDEQTDEQVPDYAFEVADDGRVILRKSVPLDVAFVDAVQSQLTEWDSAEDDEAYRDL